MSEFERVYKLLPNGEWGWATEVAEGGGGSSGGITLACVVDEGADPVVTGTLLRVENDADVGPDDPPPVVAQDSPDKNAVGFALNDAGPGEAVTVMTAGSTHGLIADESGQVFPGRALCAQDGGRLTPVNGDEEFQFTALALSAASGLTTATLSVSGYEWRALEAGAAGNDITVEVIAPGTVDNDLAYNEIGTAITVTLATDGATDPISTFADVVDIVTSESTLVSQGNSSGDIAPPVDLHPLADGTDLSPADRRIRVMFPPLCRLFD